MTYTSAAPFEFEDLALWRDDTGRILMRRTGYDVGCLDLTRVAANHAFIEAERDTWAWTNADRSEARRGRWYTFRDGAEWAIRHDDFESSEITKNAVDRNGRFLRDALHELGSFLTWAATQTPPPPAWHTPEPGSRWELTVDGHTGDWVALPGVVENALFRRVSKYGCVFPADRRVTAGREVTR